MEKIKAAIVGLGRIASLLEDDALREKPCTHAGAIAASPECELVAGCDPDEGRRRLFARRWGAPTYAGAQEMLERHGPQILAIAAHPDSRYYYCQLAARMGVSVVVCEKPLADSLANARRIAGLGKKIVIMTNHERRYSLDYLRAREILRGGTLGRLCLARAALYMGRDKRLLDVLWHDGTHLVDALMFLTDSVLRHRRGGGAKIAGNKGTAWLEGDLSQKDSREVIAPALIEVGAGRDHLVFEMEFSCEKGKLKIGNGIFEIWESAPSPYAENFRSLKLSGETFSGPTGFFANMIADAAACARDPSRRPESGAEDGLRAIEYLRSVGAWK
ncbi:MAG: Gfo/Idh/MocA family oxidoreductase [Treponema sp.]|nr:Gfo/Idh/MocA family oxidoreductase [Treponema sp.]